jgi:hypothetical protein
VFYIYWLISCILFIPIFHIFYQIEKVSKSITKDDLDYFMIFSKSIVLSFCWPIFAISCVGFILLMVLVKN